MTPATTRSVVVTANGGTDVLQIQDVPLRPTTAGELLVAVAAAGVNFVDVYQRQGVYPIPLPFTLCGEGAGTVAEVGGGVTEFEVGDRVAWVGGGGSASDYVHLPAAAAAKIPAGVASTTAAAAMVQGMTAHFLVNSVYPVQPGDWTLVHAAAGGVGQLLIQLIRARGGHVIGTVSTSEKAAKVTALGADHVINYLQRSDIAADVRELTDGNGVAAVYDGVGKTTFDASLASLRPRGVLALFGAASGQVPPFEIQRLRLGGSLFLTRPTLADHMATRAEFLQRSGAILDAVADGSLRIEIGGQYPLEKAAAAYDDLEGRRTTGKLLLIP